MQLLVFCILSMGLLSFFPHPSVPPFCVTFFLKSCLHRSKTVIRFRSHASIGVVAGSSPRRHPLRFSPAQATPSPPRRAKIRSNCGPNGVLGQILSQPLQIACAAAPNSDDFKFVISAYSELFGVIVLDQSHRESDIAPWSIADAPTKARA